MKRVKARKDEISAQSRTGVEKLAAGHGELHGLSRATRVSNRRAKSCVGDDSARRAERIFINVGGRAIVPAMPGLDQVRI